MERTLTNCVEEDFCLADKSLDGMCGLLWFISVGMLLQLRGLAFRILTLGMQEFKTTATHDR